MRRQRLTDDQRLTQADRAEVARLLAGPRARRDWDDPAACKGFPTDWFFPDSGELAPEARATCDSCVVRLVCLAEALRPPREYYGIWGGVGERARRRMAAEFDERAERAS